jgi:probable F420-dependent oxidoreductase
VRLGTSVLILPIRNPIEVAAQIAELDQLSGGRVDFGVGVGWFLEEFEALGYPFGERGARTNEGLAVCKALWREGAATFDGRFHRFEGAYMGPKPVQDPHPPVYIGGNSPAALKRLAAHGDVWHPFKITPAQIEKSNPLLAEALAAVGRPGESLPIAPKLLLRFQGGPPADGQAATKGRPQDIIDALRRHQDAGATELCFELDPETEAGALDTLERFVQEVRPEL